MGYTLLQYPLGAVSAVEIVGAGRGGGAGLRLPSVLEPRRALCGMSYLANGRSALAGMNCTWKMH